MIQELYQRIIDDNIRNMLKRIVEDAQVCMAIDGMSIDPDLIEEARELLKNTEQANPAR